MKTITFKDISIGLYTDPESFARKFYDVPENAILDMESLPDSAGFSELDEKQIWIYVGKLCSFEELLSTVSHEMGHIVTGGFTNNPPSDEKYDYLHEEKADHYEQFVMNSYELAKIIEENVKNETNLF
jgi:hypothetical protein